MFICHCFKQKIFQYVFIWLWVFFSSYFFLGQRYLKAMLVKVLPNKHKANPS